MRFTKLVPRELRSVDEHTLNDISPYSPCVVAATTYPVTAPKSPMVICIATATARFVCPDTFSPGQLKRAGQRNSLDKTI